MTKLILFLRSLLFTTILLIMTFFYSFVLLLAWPFPLKLRNHIVSSWTKIILACGKYICGLNYEITGLENIPKGNAIIFSKHQSIWETFFLQAFFPHPTIIVKKELLFVPFFGWGLATTNPIAINRGNKKSAMTQILKKGTEALKAGRWLLIFPEGTRIAPGKVGKFRMGGSRLAVHAEYPVLPIAHNAGEHWPKRGFLKKPGTIKVVIGPLIHTENKTCEQVSSEAYQWVSQTMHRIEQ